MTTTTDEGTPEVVLRLTADGTGTVTIGDTDPYPITAARLDDARTQGVQRILRLAADQARPIRFDSHEPDGEWQLLAHPDGRITECETADDEIVEDDTASQPATRTPPADQQPAEPRGDGSGRNGQTRPATAAQWRPEPAYDSGDVMLRIVPVTRIPRATRGWRGLLGIGPSKRELAERADRDAACQTFGRPVTIVVADPRGGSGKTTTSILLAGAFGNARGGGVLVLENHELRGTMHLRTDAQSKDRTIRDLLAAQHYRRTANEMVRIGDLSTYVRHQVAGQYDVIVSETKRDRALTSEEFESVHDLASRFYSVIIVDTANDESAENWRAAVNRADALVVPLKWRNDYSLPAIEMLEELQASDNPRLQDLVRRTVVVASHNHGDLDNRCQQHLKPYLVERTKAVIEIAPDPHIAEGNVIQHDQLSPATRRQSENLAAEVAHAIRAGLTHAATSNQS